MAAEIQPFFCADCDGELRPGEGIQQRDGRWVCPRCRQAAKDAASEKDQGRLFEEQRTLFNPARRRVNVEGYTDASGFHPIRASEDYNEFLAGDFDPPKPRTAKQREQERAYRAAEQAEVERDIAQSGGPTKTLAQFVRSIGGIAPDPNGMFAGELARLSFKETGTTGLINQNARQGAQRQGPEYAMDAANEEGYRDRDGRPYSNIGDFLLAVETSAVRGIDKHRRRGKTRKERDAAIMRKATAHNPQWQGPKYKDQAITVFGRIPVNGLFRYRSGTIPYKKVSKFEARPYEANGRLSLAFFEDLRLSRDGLDTGVVQIKFNPKRNPRRKYEADPFGVKHPVENPAEGFYRVQWWLYPSTTPKGTRYFSRSEYGNAIAFFNKQYDSAAMAMLSQRGEAGRWHNIMGERPDGNKSNPSPRALRDLRTPKASYLTLPEDTPEARALLAEIRKLRGRKDETALRKLDVLARALERLERKALRAFKVNPEMFGAEAKASAKRVSKIRPVVEKGTGAKGEIIGSAPGGFVKVKWQDRAKPSLVKPSQLRRGKLERLNPVGKKARALPVQKRRLVLAILRAQDKRFKLTESEKEQQFDYLARKTYAELERLAELHIPQRNPFTTRRCTTCGQQFGQNTECPMCQAGIGIRAKAQRNPNLKRIKSTGKPSLAGSEQFYDFESGLYAGHINSVQDWGKVVYYAYRSDNSGGKQFKTLKEAENYLAYKAMRNPKKDKSLRFVVMQAMELPSMAGVGGVEKHYHWTGVAHYATRAEAQKAVDEIKAEGKRAYIEVGKKTKGGIVPYHDNPHPSYSGLNAKTAKQAGKVNAKAAKLFKQADRLFRTGGQADFEKAQKLYARATALTKRAFGAGKYSEGPIGKLPNPGDKSPFQQAVVMLQKEIRRVIAEAKRDGTVAMGSATIKQMIRTTGLTGLISASAFPGAFAVALDSVVKTKSYPITVEDGREVVWFGSKPFKVDAQGRQVNPQLYDASGTGIVVGAVVKGFGLHNAGRYYTVKAIKGKRIQLSPHLGGKSFWAAPDWYRVDTSIDPADNRKGNPSVKQIAEKFQGQANDNVVNLKAANSAPRDLARIGKLVFLKINGKQLRTPGMMLASDTRERLWITGTRAPLFTPRAQPGTMKDFGEIAEICYLTAKTHIGNGKTFEYVHKFGEDGGKRPRLLVDAEGMPVLRGGDYRIKAEGIVD